MIVSCFQTTMKENSGDPQVEPVRAGQRLDRRESLPTCGYFSATSLAAQREAADRFVTPF